MLALVQVILMLFPVLEGLSLPCRNVPASDGEEFSLCVEATG